jgi:hypothetical protein
MRGLRPIRIEGIPIFILVWLIVLISHVILGKNAKVMWNQYIFKKLWFKKKKKISQKHLKTGLNFFKII